MWENRVLIVEEADVISRYHRTAKVSSTEAGYCFSLPVLYPSYILSGMHVIMSNFKPDVQLKEYRI